MRTIWAQNQKEVREISYNPATNILEFIFRGKRMKRKVLGGATMYNPEHVIINGEKHGILIPKR